MNKKTPKTIVKHISIEVFALTAVLLVISSLLLSYFAIGRFDKEIVPQMHKKAVAVGQSINALIIKAVSYGIPFHSIKGMDELLDASRADSEEIKYIAVADKEGKVIYNRGVDVSSFDTYYKFMSNSDNARQKKAIRILGYYDNSIPIQYRNTLVGSLHVGIDGIFVQNKIKDISYDIITVLIISFLISFELLLFVITFVIITPIDSIRTVLSKAREGDFRERIAVNSRDEIGWFAGLFNTMVYKINEAYVRMKEKYAAYKTVHSSPDLDTEIRTLESKYRFSLPEKISSFSQKLLMYIRPPLFLVIFSESLSLSFFPMYVEGFYTPLPGLPKEMVIGLPISIFMLFWAFSLPLSGVWSDRIGRRKPFIIGACITAAGLILTGFAHTLYDLLVWRSLTAIGYGIVYITCQGYVTDNTTAQNRTHGMAIFLSGFFSGALCGAAIGGILADRIGFRPTFVVSAVLSLLSAVFIYYFIEDMKGRTESAKPQFKFKYAKLILSNKRFLAVTIFSAIPAKVCLTGFLYYVAPLYLKFLGNSQSAIGRVLMAYGLMMVLVSPFAGKLADAVGSRKNFIFYGGLSAGAGLLMIYWFNTTVGVLAGIMMLGISHAVSVSSQLTLVTEVCKDTGEKYGLGTVIGIFRFIERAGNIAGPLVAGALIAFSGYSKAIAGIGIMTITGSVLFMIAFSLFEFFDRKPVYETA